MSNSCVPLPARRAGQAPAIASPPTRNGGRTTDRVAPGQLEDLVADARVDPGRRGQGRRTFIASRAQPRARPTTLPRARPCATSGRLRRPPADARLGRLGVLAVPSGLTWPALALRGRRGSATVGAGAACCGRRVLPRAAARGVQTDSGAAHRYAASRYCCLIRPSLPKTNRAPAMKALQEQGLFHAQVYGCRAVR